MKMYAIKMKGCEVYHSAYNKFTTMATSWAKIWA